MGSELTATQKARIDADGAPLNGNLGTITSDDETILTVHVDGEGNYEVIGHAAGTTDIHATIGSRSGSLTITVTDSPIVLDLETPVAQ